MDANKLKTLRAIHYTIRPCCQLCAYFKPGNRPGFGTCVQHVYSHLKHTEKDRELSVHANGVCRDGKFALYAEGAAALGEAWQEFVIVREEPKHPEDCGCVVCDPLR